MPEGALWTCAVSNNSLAVVESSEFYMMIGFFKNLTIVNNKNWHRRPFRSWLGQFDVIHYEDSDGSILAETQESMTFRKKSDVMNQNRIPAPCSLTSFINLIWPNPSRICSACHLLSRWILDSLVLPKRRLPFDRLRGVISQKVELSYPNPKSPDPY
jgi:hypothetical protein